MRRVGALLAVIALIASTSSFVYAGISRDNHNQVRKAFSEQIGKSKDEIARESTRYQNLVGTIGAFFNASQKVTPSGFDQFIGGLGIKSTFPAVRGIAYAERTTGAEQQTILSQATSAGISFAQQPSDTEGEHATLIYVSPANGQAPSGMDAYVVPGAQDGLAQAETKQTIVSSVPMTYQISGKKVNGYVLAYPVTGGAPIDLASNKDKKTSGWVFAYIDTKEFATSMPSLKNLNLTVTDVASGKNTITGKTNENRQYAQTFSYVIGGRVRRATLTPNAQFIRSAYDTSRAFRYAFFVANIEVVAILLLTVFVMHKTRRRREVNLTFQAGHDTLTGLPNRFFLEKWLSERTDSPTKRQQRVAVLFIDLDGFKAINDTLGHQMGDEFLVAISQRLQKEVRGRDVLARLGGDEFIVVLDEVSDEMQAMRIAQRLIEVVRFPVMLDSGPVCVGASIGIAITQLDANSDATSVIRFADAAMYAAKEDKNERIRIFDHKLKTIVDGRHEVESSIRGASARNEIIDVLQPLVDISDGTTFGYEALCRWSHPIFGVLSPDQFLDAAKVTGEIIEIDRWMVNKAFQNAIEIARTAERDTRVWVNLSVRHLLQGEFYQHVMRALRNSETTADMLGVEIEEEVFKIDNGLLYPFLNQLRDLGIAIALDDFGSEDASLQALKRYNYDVIKLDRSLITEFTSNPAASIVPAVVELARSRDMTVVAAGVETPDQLQKVIDVGCNVVQGYVFSEARSLDDLVDRQKGFTWPLPLGVHRGITRTHTVGAEIDETAQQA